MTVVEKAERAIRYVKEAPSMAFDTETSGVDWKRNYPVGYVFCVSESESLYVPVRSAGGGNLADPRRDFKIPTDAQAERVTPHVFEIELAKAFQERTRHNF